MSNVSYDVNFHECKISEKTAKRKKPYEQPVCDVDWYNLSEVLLVSQENDNGYDTIGGMGGGDTGEDFGNGSGGLV